MARFNRRQAIAALGAVEQLLAMDEGTGEVKWPYGVANSDMTEAREVLMSIVAALSPRT